MRIAMTDDELITSLNQIGKSAFVRYFHELRQGHDALLYGEYKPAGVAIRMSYSSRIFKAGREADALRIIINSGRVPLKDRNLARKLLMERG